MTSSELTTKCGPLSLVVSDLWDESTRRWDEIRIRQLFIEKDANYIIRMKYSPVMEDTHIWGTSENGIYSTKSRYKLADYLLSNSAPSTPLISPLEKGLWLRMWKVKTTPKIRHFMWKVLSGALAVADRLQSRGMFTDLTCTACGQENETICHVLFTCTAAKDVWSLSGLPSPTLYFSQSSTFLNLHYLVACGSNRNIEERTREAILWVLWHIWKARNALIFKKKTRLNGMFVMAKAKEEAEE